MPDKIARAVLELGTDDADFEKGVQNAQQRLADLATSFRGLDKQLGTIGDRLTSVGKGLSVALSAPLAAVGAAALAAGVDLDEAFDGIRIGTGATGEALQGLQDDFAAVFKDVPNSAADVSKAISDLNTSLGLTGQPLQDLSKQVLTLARITKSDLNAVLPDTTHLFNDWRVATDQQSKTLDFLFKTAQSTGASVTALMERVTQSGAAFRALGFSLDQSVALLGQWEKAGLNTDQMLSGLQIAAKKFADSNIPVEQGLKAVIAKMLELGPGTKSAALAADVFGRSSTVMAEAVFKGKLNADDLVKSLNASHDTILGAAKDTDGFAEAFKALKNSLELALNPLGAQLVQILDNLKPQLQSLGDLVAAAGRMFAALPSGVQLGVIAIGTLVAATGPAVLAIGALIKNGRELVTLLPALAAGYATIAGGVTTAGRALAEFGSGPLAVVGGAMASMPASLGALGSALLGLAVPLAGVAAGFIIAKAQLDEWTRAQDALIAKQQRQADLLAAYRKITGDTGAVLVDFTRLTKEQQAQLIALANASQDARLKTDGLNISLGDARTGLDTTGKAAGTTAVDISKLAGANAEAKAAAEAAAKEFKDEADKIIAANAAIIKAIRDLDDSMHKGDGIRVAYAEWLKDLPKVTDAWLELMPETVKQQLRDNQALADGQRAVAEMTTRQREQITTLAKWDRALSAVAQGFQQMAQIAGQSMSVVVQALGTGLAGASQLVQGLHAVQDATKIDTETMKKSFDFSSFATGILGMAGAVAGLVQTIGQMFITPEWVKVMREVGKTWGAAITEATARQIESDEDKIAQAIASAAGQFAKQATEQILARAGVTLRQGAELLNLDKIIAEGGGLNTQNLDQWIQRAQGLFSIIKLGGQAGSLATQQLSTLLEQFGEQANKAGGLWSQSFKDLIAQAQAAGAAIDQVNGLIQGQLDNLAKGTTGLAAGVRGNWENEFKKLTGMTVDEADRAMQELKDLQSRSAGDLSDSDRQRMDELTKTVNQIKDANAQIRDNTQAEFDRVTGIVLDSFNTMRAQGKSIPEAVSALGPSIQDLMAQAERFGFAGSDAYNALARWQTLVSQNQPLLDQLGTLNQLAVAQANLNGLTADSFGRIQQQGMDAYNQLIAAGFTQQEALQAAGPLLQTIIDLHEKSGLAIDDETQKLIDQAKANGDLAGTQESAQERSAKSLQHVADVLDLIAQKFGVDVPKAADDMATNVAKRVGDLATDVHDKLGGLSFEIPVDFKLQNVPGVDLQTGQYSGEPQPAPQPGFASGTPRLDFSAFRRGGQSVTVHGDEAIIPRGSGHALADEIAAALPAPGGPSGDVVMMLDKYIVGRVALREIPNQAWAGRVRPR